MEEQNNIPTIFNSDLPLSAVSLVDTETVVSKRTDTTSIRYIYTLCIKELSQH